MLKLKLQFFGGRGSGAGPNLGGGSGKPVNIKSETDIWTYRHREDNEPFVDQINEGVATIAKEFYGIMEHVQTVNAAELGGKDKAHTLGFYGDGRVALNANFTNIDKMNKTYDHGVESGYHPPRGNKTGVQAVALHEMGHALTDYLAKTIGARDIDEAAKKIVDAAYAKTKGKGGTKAWAGNISKYAQENNAECVAEAVADYYCNGNKATAQSKAIMTELRLYQGMNRASKAIKR